MEASALEMGSPGAAPSVEAGGSVVASSTPRSDVRKVIVAVHGVGDQYKFATIQTVVGQFCRRYDAPPATPLGSFHNQSGTFTFPPPGPAEQLRELAFAEVYWAASPRKLVSDKHTLEEAKQWARTIVERLHLRWRLAQAKASAAQAEAKAAQAEAQAAQAEAEADAPAFALQAKFREPEAVTAPCEQAGKTTSPPTSPNSDSAGAHPTWSARCTQFIQARSTCRESDFRLLGRVLGDIIESVSVLERLCYVADRAGLFTFDLRQLLEDYLGDVQVVAEFENTRLEILKAFDDVMEVVEKKYPDAEIHIIAHSEGTVVAFLGLLKAFRQRSVPAWARSVRGMMTIGSPIDKHLMLWPELFDGPPPSLSGEPPPRIEWRNYYDRGDPIGFELDDLRTWLASPVGTGVPSDHRARAAAGDAGNAVEGAWSRVFHFKKDHDIGFTRYPFPGKAHVDYWKDGAVFAHFIDDVVKPGTASGPPALPPGDDRIFKWASYVLPYVAVALLLFVAVYFPFSSIVGYVGKDATYGTDAIARDVGGIALLLLGVTVASRVPRLTRVLLWRVCAWFGFVACLVLALQMVGVKVDNDQRTDFALSLISAVVLAGGSLLLVVLSRFVAAVRPTWGQKPMIAAGTLLFVGMAYYMFKDAGKADDAKLWPVVLALLAYAYLWWLAALLFDLVFVWHVHIRQSTAIKRLRVILAQPESGAPGPAKPGGAHPVMAARNATVSAAADLVRTEKQGAGS